MNLSPVLFAHPCAIQAASAIKHLSAEQFQVRHVSNQSRLLEALAESPQATVFVAGALVRQGYTECIQCLVRDYPRAKFVAVVDYQQSVMASEAMHVGAADYLLQPYQPQHLCSVLHRLNRVQRASGQVIASSRISQQVLLLAQRSAQTDATVLITGESGTGKEVLASFIHQHSPRQSAPFVAINCAAIPETMLEAVLFGHVKGAYTGATQAQAGKFEEAQGGTLFLDEIGEIPPALQAKLLRVLQERQVERLGSHKTIQLDVRIIAATNVDLKQAVSERRFRQDLYYRLDVLPLQWPPLRERHEDILPLAQHFIRKYNQGCEQSASLSVEAQQVLLSHQWPGNIRELENVIQRALVMRHGQWITATDLMLPISVLVNQTHEAPFFSDKPESFPNTSEGLRYASSSMAGSDAISSHHQGSSHVPLSAHHERFDSVAGFVRSDSHHEEAGIEIKVDPKKELKQSRKDAEHQYILETLTQYQGRRNLTAEALGMSTRALRYKIAAMREQGIDVDAITRQTIPAA